MFLEGEMVILNEKASSALPYRVGTRGIIVENLHNSPNYSYKVEFDDGEILPVRENELNKLTPEDIEWMDFIFIGNKVKYGVETAKVLQVDYIYKQVEILFKDEGSFVASFSNLKPLEMEIDIVSEFKFKAGDKVKANTKDCFNGCEGVVERPFLAGKVRGYDVVFGDEKASFDENELELTEDLPFSDMNLDKFTQIAFDIGQFTDMKNQQYGSSVDATYKMIQVLMERYEYDTENYLMPKDLLKHILLQVRMMDKQNRIFNNPSGEGDSESPYKDLAGYSLIGIDMVSK